MTATLLLLLKISVGIIILAIGMDSTPREIAYLWRRPGLLLRSVLAMYVLVPLAALALVKVLTLPPGVEIGLLVLAVSAGAPLLPRKLLHIGDGAYIFSLVVTSTLLAIILVPAWLAVLGPQFGNPPNLESSRVAWVLAKSFFLPLAVGMLIRWFFPTFAGTGADGLRARAPDPALGRPARRQMVRRADAGGPHRPGARDRPLARRSRRRGSHRAGDCLLHPSSGHRGARRGLAARTTNGGHHCRLYPDFRRDLNPLLALAPHRRIPFRSTRSFAMTKMLVAALLAIGLFIGILILLEVGRRLGGRRLAIDPEGARAGTGAVEGAIFALVGLLIAFTFSGAASRFDTRRDLIVQETNAIGTAWLRLDLLPASAQPAIRENFRHYVDARLEVYRKLPDIQAVQAELAKATALQGQIWTQAVAAPGAE